MEREDCFIGPYITNESGYALIPIPNGYDEFDIVGDYKDVTNTITIDKRPILVKSESYLGSFGIQIIGGIIVGIFLIMVGMLIERKRKKRLRKAK